MTEKILIIDDDDKILKLLKKILESEGYSTEVVKNGVDGMKKFEEGQFDLVMTDYVMPEMDGLELVRRIKKVDPEFPIIIFTAYGTIKGAVDAIRLGAFDYIEKPFDKEELLFKTKKALENQQMKNEIDKLKRKLKSYVFMSKIVGKSKQMRDMFDKIQLISETDASVLITGESGTGKELIARAIHQMSPRVNNKFIAVNCAALTETLLESELFGHVKGAFTNAFRDKNGLFMEADKGTMFLDEIGEISNNIQVKLLRVLQDGEIRPVGSEKYYKVDTRVISATNKDLKKAIEEKKIREDLFYWLNVIPIYVSPLRERKEDIPLLAHHFLQKYTRKLHKNIEGFQADIMNRMISYHWPGNIRELENKIEYSCIMERGKIISFIDILLTSNEEKDKIFTYKDAKIEFEKNYIIGLLNAANGNITKAAEISKKFRKDIYNLIEKYHIDVNIFKKRKRKIKNPN